jgi:hypothetical protein
MDQISPPMRIALAVAVVFLAAYMLVLKPKDEAPAPAASTAAPAAASASDSNAAQTSLGKAVESAHGAAAATENKQNAEAAASGEATTNAPSTTQSTPSTSTTTPSTATGSAPADESLAKLPKWLQHSMDKKVVAILFTNHKAADDRRTADALKHAYRAHGDVVTRAVPLSKIADYRPVAQGVDVSQSPTLMVIDRDRQAQSLVGYSSVDTINQAIIDGLLATDNPVKHVNYLQVVQRECRQISNQAIIGDTAGKTTQGARKNIDALLSTMGASLGTLKNTPVPAAYQPLSKLVNRYIASEMTAGRTIRATAIKPRTIDSVKVNQASRKNDALQARTTLELNAVGVDACN